MWFSPPQGGYPLLDVGAPLGTFCALNWRLQRGGTVLDTLFRDYTDAVEFFEQVNEAVLEELADDRVPSADLLTTEDAARSAVLGARTLLLAELERRESALRSEWPLNDVWASLASSSHGRTNRR
jgi:hypothetical protein